MSGVEIDVDLKAAKAKQDIDGINRSLKDLAESARRGGQSFKQLNPTSVKETDKSLRTARQSAASFGHTAASSMKKTNRAADSTTSAINSVKSAVIGMTSAFAAFTAVNAFHKASDDLTNLNNKLKLVTRSSDELIVRQNQLVSLAQKTRTSFSDTTSVFSSFSKALSQTGVSSDRILKVTQTMQQGIALSGSSAESAKAALLQFSQGLAAGALRGEELNSVMEQLPYIAQNMAKAMGRTTGELRALGEAGLITPDAILAALEKMSKQASADFDKTSATVEQGMGQMSQGLKFFAGTLSEVTGSSRRFSKNLLSLGEYFTDQAQLIRGRVYSIRQSFKNYIDSFNYFNAVELTLKAAVKMDWTFDSLYNKYRLYSFTEHALKTYKDLFKQAPPVLDIGPIKVFSSEGFSLENLLSGGSKDKPETVFARLMKEVKRGLVTTVEQFVRVLPVLQGPLVNFYRQIGVFAKSTIAQVSSGLYTALNPFRRQLEGINQAIDAYTNGDTRLERAWVRMFQSKGVEEFTQRLTELNDVRNSIRFDSASFILKDYFRYVREFAYPMQDVLIQLGLLENRLIRVRDTRFDRLLHYLASFGRVTKRLFEDLLLPEIKPVLVKLQAQLGALALTLIEAISTSLNFTNGEALGTMLANGIISGLSLVERIGKGLFTNGFSNMEKYFSSGIARMFMAAMRDARDFIVAFATSVTDLLGSALSAKIATLSFGDALLDSFETVSTVVVRVIQTIRDAFYAGLRNLSVVFDTTSLVAGVEYLQTMYADILNSTSSLQDKVLRKVEMFGTRVKDIFFDAYDAVVGHSYWPDLVDGVIAYTDRLALSESRVETFGARIKRTFSDLWEVLKLLGVTAGNKLVELSVRISNFDFSGALVALKDNVSAAVVAGFFVAFGSNFLRTIGLGFFTSLLSPFSTAVFGAVGPALGAAFGDALGEFLTALPEVFFNAINTFASAGQAVFMSAFSDIFAIIPEFFQPLLNVFPYVTNTLVHAAVGLTGTLLLLSEGFRGVAGKFFFGKKESQGFLGQLARLFGPADGIGLFGRIFESPRLAAIAAGVLATAFTDAVSLIDATEVALPILAYALLGTDTGLGLARSLASAVSDVYRNAISQAGSLATRAISAVPVLDSLFTSAAGGSKSKAKIGAAFDDLFEAFGAMLDNKKANMHRYSAGQISFLDMFLTSQTMIAGNTIGHRIQFGPLFDNVIEQLRIKRDEVGKAFSEAMAAATGYFSRNVGSRSGALSNLGASFAEAFTSISGALGRITSAVRRSMGLIASAVLPVLQTMRNGLFAIFDLLRKNSAILTVAFALFSGSAFAGGDFSSVISGMSAEIGDLIVSLGAMAAGLYGIGKASEYAKEVLASAKLFKAFKAGTLATESAEEALDAFRAKQQIDREKDIAKKVADARSKLDARAAKTLKANAALSIAEQFDLTQRLREQNDKKLERYEKNLNRRRLAADNANVAGFLASREATLRRNSRIASANNSTAGVLGFLAAEHLFDPINRLSDSISKSAGKFKDLNAQVSKLREFKLSDTLNRDARSFRRASDGIGTMTAAMNLLAAGELTLGIKALFSGTAKAAGNGASAMSRVVSGIGTAKDAAKGAAPLVKRLAGNFAGLAGSIGRGLAGASKATGLTGLLKSIGGTLLKVTKFGAIAGGIGALGVALFGPGTNFVDNLGWAYDKVARILGLSASTAGGRKSVLQDLLGGNIEVGEQRVSFSIQLSNVDFSALSDAQYKVAEESANATRDALNTINEAYIRQGYMTAEDLSEIDRLQKEQKDVLLRLPQKDNNSFEAVTRDFAESIVSTESTIGDIVGNMARDLLGIERLAGDQAQNRTLMKAVTGTISVLDYITESFTSWPAIILGALGTAFGPMGTVIGTAIGGVISMIGDALGSIITTAVDGIGALFTTIGDAIMWGLEALNFAFNSDRGMFNIGAWIDSFKNQPSELQLSIKSELEGLLSGSGLDVTAGFLDAADQERLVKTMVEYRAAAEEFTKLEMDKYTGRNAESLEDYNKKLGEAMLRFISARLEANALADELSGLALKMSINSKLAADQKRVFEGLAGVVDFGKDGIDFTGSHADFKRLEELGKRLGELKLQLNDRTITDMDVLVGIRLDIKEVEKEAKALEKQIKDSVTFSADVEMKVNLLGGAADAEQLKDLFRVDPAAYRSLTELSKAYNQLWAELNDPTLQITPARLDFLSRFLEQLRKEGLGLLRIVPNIEKVKEALQELGGVDLSVNGMRALGDSGLKSMTQQISNLRILRDEYGALARKGSSMKELAEARERIERAEQGIRDIGSNAQISGATAVVDNKSLSNFAKAAILARELKVDIPESIAGNSKALGEWAKLQLQIAATSSVLASNVANGSESNQKIIDDLSQSLVGLNSQMTALTTVSTYTMDSLIGSISEAGIAVDTFSFSRLKSSAQIALSGIGSQLDSITKQLSEASAAGVVGDALRGLMDRRQALLKQAREFLADVLHATGAGISEGLSRVGISEFKAIAKLSKDRLSTLLSMDKQLELAKLELNDTTDLDGYISAVKQVANLERQAARAVAAANRNMLSDMEAVNEAFGTSLDQSDLLSFNSDVFSRLADYAVGLKFALEDALEYGKSAAGETAQTLFAKMRDASRAGEYLTFFSEMKRDVYNAFTSGAKTAFDQMSDLMGDLSVDFDSFLMIPDAVRQAYSAQSAALANYERALNLPNLSDNLVSILNQVGKPVEDILREFESQFYAETGATFNDAMQTSTQQLIGSQDALREETKRLADAMGASPSGVALAAPKIATGGQSGAPAGIATPVAGFQSLRLRSLELANNLRESAISSARTPYDKARAALSNSGLVDIQALRLATDKQLKGMLDVANLLRKKSMELEVAAEKGIPTQHLQKDVIELSASLEDMGRAIQDSPLKAREAGKQMSSEFGSAMTKGVADILKGDAEEGASSFKGLLDVLLDTFTNSVIDAFVGGLMEPLTGENGSISTLMKEIGTALFNTGKGGALSATGLFGVGTGEDPQQVGTEAVVAAVGASTQAQQGFFANLGSIFSSSFDGLMGAFSAFGGLLQSGFGSLMSAFSGGGGGGSGWAGLLVKGVSAYFGGGGATSSYTGAYGFANGGPVFGPGTSTSDSINAWLSNGEFVMNASATKRNLRLLSYLNNGGRIGAFALGGMVGSAPSVVPTPNVGSAYEINSANLDKASNEQVFNINVTGDITRATRKEIQMMIPQIAAGVSKHNFERRGR